MNDAPDADPLRFWREPMEQFLRAVESMQGRAQPAEGLLAPLRRQAELFQEAMQQQARNQAELMRGLLEPARRQAELVGEAAAQMHAQAEAFQQVAEAFQRAARLVEAQAGLLDQAAEPMRRQVEFLDGLSRPAAGD